MAGSYAVSTGDECKSCESGKYQSESLQTACEACEEGKYNSNTGSVSTSDCTSW